MSPPPERNIDKPAAYFASREAGGTEQVVLLYPGCGRGPAIALTPDDAEYLAAELTTAARRASWEARQREMEASNAD